MNGVLIDKYIFIVCAHIMKYSMDEWKKGGGSSALFTLIVVSEDLNKAGTSFFFHFEVQLYHHQMSSEVGLSGMFHRLSRYLLLKYVHFLRVFAFIWSLLMWTGRLC